MFIKLALNNIKKSYKDYLIYFLTIAFGIALFYLFNSMSAQQELMKADYISLTAMSLLSSAMSYVSIAMTAVLAFLMVYANQFLIKRRKKELGIYITLGMSRLKLSYILVLETFMIGIVSLFVGLLIGIFGSHLLAIVTASIFDVEMTQFKFVVSVTGIIKSLIYFGCVFVLVMVFNIYNVNRIKVIHLLNGDKLNNRVKVMHPLKAGVIMLGACLSLAYAYHLILKNAFRTIDLDFELSIVLGIIGTILFFLSFSHMVMYAFRSQKKIYYRQLNAFSFKQISSKVRQTYLLISIVCILLLVAMGTICAGMSMVGMVDPDLTDLPYELSLRNTSRNEAQPLMTKVPEINDYIEDYQQILLYEGTITYGDINRDFDHLLADWYKVPLMSLSDYNKIRMLQDKTLLSLDDREYYVITNMDTYGKVYEKAMADIAFDGVSYKAKGYEYFQYDNDERSSNEGVVIVADKVLEGLTWQEELLIVTDEIEDSYALVNTLSNLRYDYFFYVNGRDDILIQLLGTKTIVAYVALYIGFVFIMTTVVCLSLQQLTDVSDHIKRYELLIKLGVEERQIKKSLALQLGVYFLMPLGLAVVHSIIGIKALTPMLVFLGEPSVLKYAGFTACFIGVIYGIYYLATYTMTSAIVFKRNT